MTLEEELVLQDICSRYPYGVILHFNVEQDDEPLFSIRKNGGKYLINDAYYLEEVKPYLRSIDDDMTEEEEKEYINLMEETQVFSPYFSNFEDMIKVTKWLIEKMFDYNDLIKKGLALKAPKGMYNLKD